MLEYKGYKPARVIHIRSQDVGVAKGVSGSLANYNISINPSIDCDPDEYMLVSVNSAQIPFSFYNVNASNNLLTGDDGASYTATLTQGNYNITQLLAEIKTKVNAASGTHDITATSYDNKTNKVTITTAGNTTFSWATGINPVGKLIGFTADGSAATSHISDAQVNTGGEEAVYIRSSLHSINSYESRTGGSSDILAKVPNMVSFYGIIHYQPPVNVWKCQLQRGQTLSNFGLSLTDSEHTVLEMNGMNWEVSLLIEFRKAIEKKYVETKDRPVMNNPRAMAGRLDRRQLTQM